VCIYIAKPVRQHAALQNFLGKSSLSLSHNSSSHRSRSNSASNTPTPTKTKNYGLFIIAHALAFPLSLFAPWTMRFRCGLDKLWQLQKHT